MLFQAMFIDGPFGITSRRFFKIKIALRVCNQSQVQVLSIDSNQHGAVIDLLTGDSVQLNFVFFCKGFDNAVLLINQVVKKQGSGEPKAVGGGEKNLT